jgi:invasion protein IalB
VCSTTKVASDDQGHAVFSAAFIEVEGEQAKTLRITVPMLDLLRNEGPQVSVDYQASLQMPPPGCPPSPETSCVAQSVATADLIGKLKLGQALIILATSQQGTSMTFTSYLLPLSGFAEANESSATSGAPTVPARH